MAEMVIWLHDRDLGDVYKTAKVAQRGDVITVQPDGWNWAANEAADPFLLVSVPDAAVADLQEFLSNELPQPGNETDEFIDLYNTLQFRGFKVDIDAYTGGVLRSGASVPLDDVLALKVQRPPIPDPKTIGNDKVIG